MKKRVFSIIVAMVVLLSCFSPAAFAESSGNYGQTSPDPSCEHEWNECDFSGWTYEIYKDLPITVTVYYCAKCKVYKHVFSVFGCNINYYSLTGLSSATGEFQDFAIYNLSKIVGKVGNFIIANTESPTDDISEILPGYQDDSGTAQVGKEGKLVFIAIPQWNTYDPDDSDKGFLTPLYEDYHFEQRKPTYASDYDFDWTCLTYVNRRYSSTFYGDNKYGLRNYINVVWQVPREIPGTYYIASGQCLTADYRNKTGAAAQCVYTKAMTWNLPSTYKTSFGNETPYLVYNVATYFCQESTATNTLTVDFSPIRVTCDPDENPITEKETVKIGDNTFKGKIYVDNDTKLTYIYPEVPTTGDDGDTITIVPDHPLIYNPESQTYYIYEETTNNYYYLDYTPQATPTPSPSPSPSPTPSPSPSPAPTATPTPSPTVTPTPVPTETPAPTAVPTATPTATPGSDGSNDHCDHTGIIAVLEQIRDKMVAGFTDISANILTGISNFQAAVAQGFVDIKAAVVQAAADISANFSLAIENLNVNIQNIFNKKFEDLPEATPTPSPATPTPTPSPATPTPTPSPTSPPTPVHPDTQNYIIPTMNANSFTNEHGTWIASGSSFAENRFAYYNAFNPDGFWVNGLGSPSGAHGREMPCWLQIEIPDPESYYVDGYMIKCGPDDNFDIWQILGSNDGETWETLDSRSESLADDNKHTFPVTLHKAYKYYRLYIEHFSDYMGVKQFNLLGYDAEDVTLPTPSPAPTDSPDVTPTPAPTDKPSDGDKTNNFWTIIFPSGGDDSSGEHKGIFWALVSLILALIAFFTNLAAGVGYLFPFLPDGVVLTINTCLFVIFLFVIVKFIMRSK